MEMNDMTNDHDKILCERLATSIDHGICKCAERSRIAALEMQLAAERERRKSAEDALRERPGQWYPTLPIVEE